MKRSSQVTKSKSSSAKRTTSAAAKNTAKATAPAAKAKVKVSAPVANAKAKAPVANAPVAKAKAPVAKATAPTAKAKARKAEAAMFQKIAFTLLPVEDTQRARGFYEDVLGLTRGLAAPNGVWTEYDLPGGGCLALFRHPDPKHAQAPGGGGAVAFEVADLDALNQRLTAAGVRYQGDIVHGPHCRMSNILDSEGNSLILHQLDLDR